MSSSSQTDARLSDLQERIKELLHVNSFIKFLMVIDNTGIPIVSVSSNNDGTLSSDHEKRLAGAVAAAVALANRAMKSILSDGATSFGIRTESGNVGVALSDNFMVLLVTDKKANARILALQAERALKVYV